ncbi:MULTISPECIES: DUF3015 family protein [Pseudoalteromonas]|uniref:DUF3015 family protein n=1 Tax=Pseudoalteromonas TaxID=53246 RepID=UPI00083D672A|nr:MULTISPECIES: DUF3015 family protein [Pseudoalteromonas]AUJ68521.1 hypothetical protein PNC201_00845 [Pseudoalteromonas sp. NC201]MBR8844430.1 DUF3015 family protein [Pseudoalteromonas sp. JC3]MCF2829512.1 DUF3015 domain-containing protein [Pseudoalteromonas sp. OF5H-5]MCF2831618.1 DUF3015 domain-containing protein [Pseudoalteromonas sp. DL2-H6]MCF2927571.1 DUF3015 domain-containing protein [Pseudoalteromonas sp. DL2-H1]
MFKTTLAAAIVVGAMTAPLAAHASDSVNPWQECGIGAIIFPDNGAAAAISNIIWDLGTTAVSTKISSVESCAGREVKTAMFIQQTFPTLEQEIAEGQGEYVSAMLAVRGCDAAATADIVTAIRNDYAAQPANNAEALYNIVETRVSTSYSAQCNAS